jgi:hypothetical protein
MLASQDLLEIFESMELYQCKSHVNEHFPKNSVVFNLCVSHILGERVQYATFGSREPSQAIVWVERCIGNTTRLPARSIGCGIAEELHLPQE